MIDRFIDFIVTDKAESDRLIKNSKAVSNMKAADAARKKIVNDMSEHFKNNKLYDSNYQLVKNNKLINSIHKHPHLQKARKELDELGKMTKGYTESEDVRYEYKIKALAGIKYGNMTIEKLKKEFDVNDTWLMYEDWDQGNYGSFDLYLRDKGTNLDEYFDKTKGALEKYRTECKKVTDGLLKDRGSAIITRGLNQEEVTASDALADALMDYVDEKNELTMRYM